MSNPTYRTHGTDRPYDEPVHGANRRFGASGYYSREHGHHPGGLMASVMDQARESPIGAALVGMGLVWLLSGDRTRHLAAQAQAAAGGALSAGGSLVADMARSTGDAIGSAAGYATDMGASAARQAADMVTTAASRTSEAVSAGANQAGDLAGSMAGSMTDKLTDKLRMSGSQALSDVSGSTRSQLGQMLHEQPLLLAAGAFAVGAAMAASLPLTETEERVIGEAARNAMQSGETADSMGARLQKAATAAKEEARRQGLTPDALKTEAAHLRDKATGAMSGQAPHSRSGQAPQPPV